MPIRLDDPEMDALMGVSHLAFRLYVAGIRTHMDYRSGRVGAVRAISYQSLAESVYVEPVQGRHRHLAGSPTIKAIRNAIDELIHAGLLRKIPAERRLVFDLTAAARDSSVRNMRGRGGAEEGQTMKGKQKPSNDAESEHMRGRGGADPDMPMRGTHPTSDIPEKQEPPPIPPPEPPSRFAEFWNAWPAGHKCGRKVCAAKWSAKKLDRIADQIIADVQERQARDDRWLRGFIPNPVTYLNQERWNDDMRPHNPGRQPGERYNAATITAAEAMAYGSRQRGPDERF